MIVKVFLDIIDILPKTINGKKVYIDEQGKLHNIKGPVLECLEGTNTNAYYIHGRRIPKEIFLKIPTKEEFVNLQNQKWQEAWIEILGAEKICEILEDTNRSIILKNLFL